MPGAMDTLLNVLLFVPLGLFLPLLYGEFDSIRKIATAGFLISLSVEIIQMFGFGATDINDLMTNTIGACLGYGIYTIAGRAIPQPWIGRMRIEGPQCYWELLLFWTGSLLIMLSAQVRIFNAFFAAPFTDGEMQVWE